MLPVTCFLSSPWLIVTTCVLPNRNVGAISISFLSKINAFTAQCGTHYTDQKLKTFVSCFSDDHANNLTHFCLNQNLKLNRKKKEPFFVCFLKNGVMVQNSVSSINTCTLVWISK